MTSESRAAAATRMAISAMSATTATGGAPVRAVAIMPVTRVRAVTSRKQAGQPIITCSLFVVCGTKHGVPPLAEGKR